MSESSGQPLDPPAFTELYRELRAIAGAMMRDERRGHTLQPTALVSEAYLKLVNGGRTDLTDRRKFCFAAAEAMRRILIDHGRKRQAEKRGGGAKRPIPLDDLDVIDLHQSDQIVSLDEAIVRLEERAPEEAQVVRLRFYAGLNMEEIAEAMNLSVATVKRAWRYARAWLWRELNDS
jgi:RNA polymerase sigma factor (TIGR02999 family)